VDARALAARLGGVASQTRPPTADGGLRGRPDDVEVAARGQPIRCLWFSPAPRDNPAPGAGSSCAFVAVIRDGKQASGRRDELRGAWRNLGRSNRMPNTGFIDNKGDEGKMLAPRGKDIFHAIRLYGRHAALSSTPRRPKFVVDIMISDRSELRDRLLKEGLDPGEVIFKYCWPRYAPPLGSGIRSKFNSESLSVQFERLIAMHHEAPARIPMPVAIVKSVDGEFAGYILEYVEGETLQTLISVGMVSEARRHLAIVEDTIMRLHAKGMAHGDINSSNVIAADDGRTVLIDPVPNPGSGTKLQDEICIGQIRRQIDLDDHQQSAR